MRAAKLVVAGCLAGATAVPLAAAANAAPSPPRVRELVGTLRLDPGSCHHGHPAGSYLAVTFGTKAIKNASSTCGGGAYTLLSPATPGVVTGHYAEAARGVFDDHAVQLVTRSQNYAAPPRLYLVGRRIRADLRSVDATYQGGTYPVGDEQATGRYAAGSGHLSLQWFSGQSFTPESAGTEVHLEGTFDGTSRPLARGTTVNLGTASFAAGGATPVAHAAADRWGNRSAAVRRHQGRPTGHRVRLAARSESTTTGSPKTFLIAELVVVVNIVAFLALSRKRGRK